MTEKLEKQLLAIEDIIAQRDIITRHAVFESIDNLIKQYPQYIGDIQNWYQNTCKKHQVDFFSDIRWTEKERNKYLKDY